MKIVVYSENNYGCGASIAAYRLVKGLSKENDVFFVYEENKSKINIFKNVKFSIWHLGKSTDKFKNKIFKGFRLLSKLTRTNIDRWFLFELFYRKMKHMNPDVIHFHNTYFTHQQIAKLSQEFPVVWTMHDQFALFLYNYKVIKFDKDEKIYCPIDNWRKKFYKVEKLLNNENANVVFTPPSQWLVNLGKTIVKDRKRIETIHNGIDTNDFFPVDKKIARKELNLEDKFTLLFLAGTGAWERKNSIVIFEALKLIPDLDIQVLVIGSVTKFNFDDNRVVKKGAMYSTKALRNVYSSADIFCIPSVIDNLPNTVLESLLCGVPVLGSNKGGIQEMIIDGKTGWSFDPYSAKDLSTKIEDIYNKRDNRTSNVEECRNSVIDKFSVDTMVENYTKLYKELKRINK